MNKSRTERILEPLITDTPEALARFEAIMELPPYKIGQPLLTKEQVRERNEFVDKRTVEILANMMQSKIILYTTHCPLCEQLEKELKKRDINYSIVNDKNEMIKLGFDKVPVLQIGDEYLDFKQAITTIRNGLNERQ